MLTQQLTRTTLLLYQLDWTIMRNGTACAVHHQRQSIIGFAASSIFEQPQAFSAVDAGLGPFRDNRPDDKAIDRATRPRKHAAGPGAPCQSKAEAGGPSESRDGNECRRARIWRGSQQACAPFGSQSPILQGRSRKHAFPDSERRIYHRVDRRRPARAIEGLRPEMHHAVRAAEPVATNIMREGS